MRPAIALLLTLFFIMLITLSLGVGLGYMKKMTYNTQQEQFMIQSRVILDDFLTMLKSSKDLDALIQENNSSEAFYNFITSYSTIPLAHEEIEVLIQLSSARGKFNPNTLVNEDALLQTKRFDALKEYFNKNNINSSYADVMLDILNTKENYYPTSDIFYMYPQLSRGSLASLQHQQILSDFFANRYRDNSINNIDFDKFFIYTQDTTTKVDLNFASAEVWSLLIGCESLRAQEILQKSGTCQDLECFGLSVQEIEQLNNFAYSFYEPIIEIKLSLRQNNMHAFISFEYDMKQKKGYHFVYQI
jgi:hypothetical protein